VRRADDGRTPSSRGWGNHRRVPSPRPCPPCPAVAVVAVLALGAAAGCRAEDPASVAATSPATSAPDVAATTPAATPTTVPPTARPATHPPTHRPATRPPTTPPPTTRAPVAVRTTTAPKPVALSTCGAPSNPWGYNFCGRGAYITDPPASFCDVFNCIPSFWKSTNGYVMQCDDLTYSHSGGRSGSCSYHGGNYRALYG
jgi:hypothetical protein